MLSGGEIDGTEIRELEGAQRNELESNTIKELDDNMIIELEGDQRSKSQEQIELYELSGEGELSSIPNRDEKH